MNDETNQSSSTIINDQPHCHHRTASGRRCRLAVAANSSMYCLRHLPVRPSTPVQVLDLDSNAHDTADLYEHLTWDTHGFQTAQGINFSLTNLYKLLAMNRVSPRRAAVLSYISSLLLRTLPQIDTDNSHGVTFPPPGPSTEPDPDPGPHADPDAEDADKSNSAPAPAGDSDASWDPSIPEPDPTKKPS